MFTRCYASRKLSRAKGARPFETPAATAAPKSRRSFWRRRPEGGRRNELRGTGAMAEFNVRVAFRGELMLVLRIAVTAAEGHAWLTDAMHDELAIADFDQDPEEGEVWIDLYSDAGEWLLHECARFHRADASEALRRYFGVGAEIARVCLARANVARLYAEHCAIVQEWAGWFGQREWR